MKKGLNLWTITGFEYSERPQITKLMEIAAELKYQGVEMIFDDNLLEPSSISKDERKRYVEKAESLGLEIPSVATGVFWKYNLGSSDSRVREKGLEYIRKGLELAHDLGSKVLLVVPGVADPAISYSKIYENSVKSLRESAKYAEDLGVIIGLENVWSKFLYSPLEFAKILDDVGSSNVQAYFDVGNVVALGYHEHWIEVLKGKIAMVHVKDFDENVGGLKGFRHVGKGSINWNNIINLLKDSGYNGFLNVEAPPEFYPDLERPRYPEDGIRAAKDNSEALDKILKGL